MSSSLVDNSHHNRPQNYSKYIKSTYPKRYRSVSIALVSIPYARIYKCSVLFRSTSIALISKIISINSFVNIFLMSWLWMLNWRKFSSMIWFKWKNIYNRFQVFRILRRFIIYWAGMKGNISMSMKPLALKWNVRSVYSLLNKNKLLRNPDALSWWSIIYASITYPIWPCASLIEWARPLFMISVSKR